MFKTLSPNQKGDPNKIVYEYWIYHIPSKTLSEGRVEVSHTIDFMNFLSQMNSMESPDCLTWKYWKK